MSKTTAAAASETDPLVGPASTRPRGAVGSRGALRPIRRAGPSGGPGRPRSLSGSPRALLLLLLITLLGLPITGCRSLVPPGWGAGEEDRAREIPLRIERPEAPPEYDVLVGELAEREGGIAEARAAFERAAAKDPGSAFIHHRLARLSWQLDDVERAVEEAELALELAPESVEIRLFLGRLYRLRRDFEGLDRVLRDAEGEPLDADSAYTLFQVALDRGELAEAEALARELISSEPDQLRGALALATVQERRGELDAAEATVRGALESFPDHFLLYMRLAQIERERENRAGEIAVYREVLDSHPLHYGILQRLGQAQIEGNDLEAAIETYRKIVEAYPEDLASLRRLASLEFSAGRYEAAAGRLETVLAREPDQPEIALALGQIRRAAGDEIGAMEAFERIGKEDSSYVEARIQIAALHEAAGRLDEALAEIEALRARQPSRRLAFQAAALRARMGDLDGAVVLLESLLEGSPEDAEVYYQIGIQYGLQDRREEALAAMRRVLEIEPENANALNYIGYSWAEQGENLEQAEELIRRALEIAPRDGYITDSLGWVYYRMAESLFEQSREEEARRFLERAEEQLLQAAELTGGDSVVAEHLGDVRLLLGDREGALEYYEQAEELGVREDEQPELREKLERLRRELGRPAPTPEAP